MKIGFNVNTFQSTKNNCPDKNLTNKNKIAFGVNLKELTALVNKENAAPKKLCSSKSNLITEIVMYLNRFAEKARKEAENNPDIPKTFRINFLSEAKSGIKGRERATPLMNEATRIKVPEGGNAEKLKKIAPDEFIVPYRPINGNSFALEDKKMKGYSLEEALRRFDKKPASKRYQNDPARNLKVKIDRILLSLGIKDPKERSFIQVDL